MSDSYSPITAPKDDGRSLTWSAPILLALILFLGMLFRLTGVNWDELQHLHPDERFLTMVTSALSFPGEQTMSRLPAGCMQWGGYFDTACSPLNPYNHDFGLFVYGTFPIFLTRLAGEMVNQAGYDQIHLVGRVLSALFDLSTVLLIFFIGRRMYGVRAGLLAALFLAASVLDIQQSHFFTVDTFTNLPILLAFWYAMDIADGTRFTSSGQWVVTLVLFGLLCTLMAAFIPGPVAFGLLALLFILLALLDRLLPVRYGLAGAAFGLALAGRINIAPFAVVLIAGAALRAFLQAMASRRRQMPENGSEPASVERARTWADAPEVLAIPEPAAVSAETRRIVNRSLGPVSVSYAWRPEPADHQSLVDTLPGALARAFIGLTLAAVVALVVFRTGQPYAANGPSFISPHFPHLDLSRGSVNALFDVALSWAGGVNTQFADNMTYVSQLVAGTIDSPPGHQWTNRTPYVFPFENMVEWGLGLPLGLAGWAGFLLALYQLLRYRRWQHLLIVVWVGVTFAYTGQQFVKTMRYFLQIYPFLALLAGWFLVELWDRVSAWSAVGNNGRTLLKGAVLILGLVVAGYTLFWATAFTTIYTRPVSRVAASRWMLQNIPPGSVLANEHWDDPLPLRIDGQDPWGGTYRNLPDAGDGEMHWYDEDTPEKRVQAIGWLDAAQYIVLSSNRLYGSIPRLPMRYPMTTKYYQWLFDGTLGFAKIATFTSRPQLFGIEIDDDNAEEAYTVYDHPKVLIFKKTPQYSHANTVALFDSVDLSEVYRLFPPQATQAPTALLLTPQDWDTQMRGGTWSQIFDPGDWINQIPVIGWLGMVEILGWLAFPLAFVVFRALADRGYIFAKALGILLAAWGAWMLASFHLLEFGRFSIVFVLLAVFLAGLVILRLRWREMFAFLRDHAKTILVEEVLFLAFFGLDLAIRYGNPDLWHPYFGGEKPMDFAYLNAVIKSTWFPPFDPWFAGGYIDYYYFGQLITATLVRLSGIVPEVAYNLALPMYFGLLAMGAFSVVLSLVTRMPSSVSPVDRPALRLKVPWSNFGFALLGALFVAVIGNLGELILIGQALIRIGGGENATNGLEMLAGLGAGIVRLLVDRQGFDIPVHWWYWNASRIIPETINEFPFFTFLYADLHAHLMALPFTVVVIGLAVNFIRLGRTDAARLPFWPFLSISLTDIVEVLVTALVLGSLRAINYADYVTFPLVIAGALAIGEFARRRRIDLAGLAAFAWRLIAILILSSLLYQPFISHFVTASASIELWSGPLTRLPEYLGVHGIFLFAIASYLVWQTFHTRMVQSVLQFVRMALSHGARLPHLLDLQRELVAPSLAGDIVIVVMVAFALFEVAFVFTHAFVFAFVFPLVVLTGLLFFKPDLDPERRFVLMLIGAGLALTLAVELVRYKDDIGRMNTVFKFYLQVWVFFAIAAAASLAFMMGKIGAAANARWARVVEYLSPTLRFSSLSSFWWAGFILLLCAGFLYPVMGARAKVNDRFVADSPPGLNGMEYMQQAVYQDANRDLPLEFDREAILWLRENVQGSPVILEANGPLYHWTSRVSINTGLPTVIGWDWHQKQQRSIIDSSIVDHRINDVHTLYTTTNIPDAVSLLKRFRVAYIYVGDMERAFYGDQGMLKFDAMAAAGQVDLVYQNEHVKIYHVKSVS